MPSPHRLLPVFLILVLGIVLAKAGPVEEMINFVVVADQENPDEDGFAPFVGSANVDLENNGIGYVAGIFEIAETEATNEMYVRFLNAVASSDRLYGLYSTKMGTDPAGGILRSGADGSYAYRLKDGTFARKPVNFVSSFDAMRFMNWLHNGMLGDGAETVVNMSAGSVGSVSVLSGGRGYIPPPYDPSDPLKKQPKVVFIGSSASGAQAVSTISSGTVTSVNVTSGGSGYTIAPRVVFSGGGGSRSAEAQAVVENGEVVEVVVTDEGQGYTSAPSVELVSTAEASVVVGPDGSVSAVNIIYGGSGYTAAPLMVICGMRAQDRTTTEDGAYTLVGKNPDDIVRRNLGARYFLPDIDEFHKAAYYDPDPGGDRPSQSYWPYADQRTENSSSNFYPDSDSNPLREVGLSEPSHYGTRDQDGNVAEWSDSLITTATRAIAGGGLSGRPPPPSVPYPPQGLREYAAAAESNLLEVATLGFRVARNPEPIELPDPDFRPVLVSVAAPDGLGNDDDDLARPFPPDNDNPEEDSLGAVSYSYKISAFETTNEEYSRFLTAVAHRSDLYGLHDARMAITKVKNSDGTYVYEPSDAEAALKPVVYVNLFSAMRFCNWLHNGALRDSDTESGAYRLLGNLPADTKKIKRSSGARYFIPTENEWYKAAFYAPASETYNLFATRRDVALASEINFNSNPFGDFPGALVSVLALDAPSWFGTFHQSGNAEEWTESLVRANKDGLRYTRGGSYADSAENVSSGGWNRVLPQDKYPGGIDAPDQRRGTLGFRVAAADDVSSGVFDSDLDGMPNGWETFYGFDPEDPSDATLDADGDGLNNVEEYRQRDTYGSSTNPKEPDSDGDDLTDGVEVKTHGTNPLRADTDGDSLPDKAELEGRPATDPLKRDTDGDGLADNTELLAFLTDPLVTNDIPFFVLVDDPRNPDDDGGDSDIQNTGRGYVAQEFQMSVTEVTNWMYVLFLNSVAKRDRLYGLYKTDMGDNPEGGIVRRGSQGSYTYEAKAGFEGKPVNFISIWDALRYVNWLHNWKSRDDSMRLENRPTLTGSQDQNAGTTEDGAYALLGANPENFTRNSDAHFFLPDVDEWHKAAYYDPSPGDGRPDESYWDWATQKMNPPTNEGLSASTLALVPVGTASGDYFGPSHYGTYDQDGNVEEWVQDAVILGGRKTSTAPSESERASLGFRVARPVADSTGTSARAQLLVEVNQPGNLADEEFAPQLGDPKLGAVNYTFQMGAYEVTNREYARFLNAKAKEDSVYRLYDARMGSDSANGGITRSGVNGNYVYTVKRGMALKPVVYVSIFSAMRYCNWLHNGGRADSDMEAGAYRLLGNVPPNTENLTRNATARYYLPNANEFYKAAYYDASRSAAAQATFDYWKFATTSDEYDEVINSSSLQDVDSHSARSFFGTYGQSGNVGYANPESGPNTAAPKPTAANTGELLEEASNTDDESPTKTFRIAAAAGLPALRPLNDEDADELSNAWEYLNDLDPFDATGDNGAAGDPDGDGLTNLQELQYGLDPLVKDADKDSDGDGLSDWREADLGTRPDDKDSDDDLLEDGDEVDVHRTNPLLADTDNDGASDFQELFVFGTDPFLPSSAPDAPTFVRVGDPGNPDEDIEGEDLENAGIGYVGQEFEIGVTEVTNLMYAKFLNAVAKSDALYGLYSAEMGSSPRGGILRAGVNGSYVYTVKAGFETQPVNYVSVFDAMRYCNWLHNGMPETGVQNASTTEDGAYKLDGSNPPEMVRRAFGARYFLPDQDEWHKAAYYDPAGPSGASQDYWFFADRSAAGPGGNFEAPRNLRVGTSSGSSHYGTFDQDGNVREWLDASLTGSERLVAGGGCEVTEFPGDSGLILLTRNPIDAEQVLTEKLDVGFRVARPVSPSSAAPVSLPRMVKIGAPGNLPDTNGKGAVAYEYQIGVYEVTNEEYAQFLNAVARNDSPYGLYDDRMGSDQLGGIERSGAAGSYAYTVKPGHANRPVNFVTAFNAMRYCNWLHNGAQSGSDTESGAYRLLGNVPPDTSRVGRNFGARYFLPDENEWHKAAYYDPSPLAASTGQYWDYAVRSDNPSPSQVAVRVLLGLVDVNQPGVPSYFGTFGQNGNVSEWSEEASGGERLVLGGGIFSDWSSENRATELAKAANPEERMADRGFRIAARVDSPSTLLAGPPTGSKMQSIKFRRFPVKKVYKNKPLKIRLRAKATSRQPVVFESDNTAIAKVMGSKKPYLLVTGTGTVTVTARQPGDGEWAPAANVQQTIEIVPRKTRRTRR